MILLKRYLENNLCFSEAVYLFPAILGKIGELRNLCRDHLKMLSPVIKRSKTNPLMAELFSTPQINDWESSHCDNVSFSSSGSSDSSSNFGTKNLAINSDEVSTSQDVVMSIP